MVFPLLLASFVFVTLVAYQLARPRTHDCEPIDERPVRVVRGRVVGPKAAGEVVCRIDEAPWAAGEGTGFGAAELSLIVDFAGDKVLVLARGAVISARWPHRRADLRVGDRIAVAGVLGDLRREEALYRQSGCAFGLEALRIVAGGLPPARGLMVSTIASGALTLGCLLLLLTPLGSHTAPLLGLPCPAGTRLEGRPRLLGASDWTQVCRDARGRLQGPTARWSAAGMQLSEGAYLDGRRHGQWRVWLGPGLKTVEGAHVDGERHGLWTEWDSRGRLRVRGRYQRGKREGRFIFWRRICRDRGGLLPTSYSYPRRLQYLGKPRRMACTYRAGRLHGPFTLVLGGGTRLDGHFRAAPFDSYDGDRAARYQGRWNWRNAAGTKLMQSSYEQGVAAGPWIRWSAAGKRVLEGSYRLHRGDGSQMSGRWTRYRPDQTVAWACAFADGLAAGWLPPCRQELFLCRDLSERCDARLGDVVPRRPKVRGALSAADVERAVYARLEGLSLCHPYVWPRLKRGGTVTIGLAIRRGWVEGAWVARSSLREDIADCVADELSRVTFPPVASMTHVGYTFEIVPERYRLRE